MDYKNILITGCGGMLGKAAYDILSKKSNVIATDIDLNEDWLSYLDVRDIDQCEEIFKNNEFDVVFHLAAYTDLEYCELNKEDTWLTNALGPENIALMCNKYNMDMVYISTAGIMDGEQEYYNDFDNPNPLSYYAKAKYHGEIVIPQLINNYYIFRAGWMMGGLHKDKKFINKILKQINSGVKELNVVDDKLGTPTYTYDFINNIIGVLDKKYYGIYNQVCDGDCSRYDVAKEIIEYLELDIDVKKVNSDYFKKEYFAPRPYSEKLINLKLNKRNLNNMRDWKICLREYLDDIKKEGLIK